MGRAMIPGKKLLTLCAGPVVCSLHLAAQVTLTSSVPVANTRLPAFQGGMTSHDLANFRIHLDYTVEEDSKLRIGDGFVHVLPKGEHRMDLTWSRTGAAAARVSSWIDEKVTRNHVPVDDHGGASFASADPALRMDRDFTVEVEFQSTGDGPLFTRCAEKGAWSQGGKALFIRDGRIVYDVFREGLITGPPVNDGKTHRVVVSSKDGVIDARLGKRRASKPVLLRSADVAGHVFKIGRGAATFTGDLTHGSVSRLRFWPVAMANHGAEEKEEAVLPDSKPVLDWSAPAYVETFGGKGLHGPVVKVSLEPGGGFHMRNGWIQPLQRIDHAGLIGGWNKQTYEQGKNIYQSLCVTCHGTESKEGSMPTSRKLHAEAMKNGADPFRMFQTLQNGYGLMPPMHQFSDEEKYAVIHYVREGMFKTKNPTQYTTVDADYLSSLPKPLGPGAAKSNVARKPKVKPFEEMDFGNYLMWTYQLNPGQRGAESNIAYKGIAVRVDEGQGGISKGKAWMVYNEDTMRMAAAYTGDFIDWRCIAFDGSHGTHPGIAGKPLLLNPDAPEWMHPVKKTWDDERIIGRDNRRYGPLPKEWIHYRGIYRHGAKSILSYQVGQAQVLELPGLITAGENPVFTRTLEIGPSTHDIVSRLAKDDPALSVVFRGTAGIRLERGADGFLLHIPASKETSKVIVGFSSTAWTGPLPDPVSLSPLTKGGPSQFTQVVKTEGKTGPEDGAFAMDVITTPNKQANPWNSWLRVGGFDFFPDNPDRMAVCTWYGDVWLVDGVSGDLQELRWRRICTGMFQPLGLKIVGGKIHVTCRDQIARLHDYNGDEEIDFIESFNNDHQVTENFHEFAMGLQADAQGNLYYAKSARHARPGLVPHHGTLLRVRADGSRTDIIARGLRAANGVCLNPDGTWIVSDQEGEWCPKNRINYIKEGGFYGNMLGYHDVTDPSDSMMQEPVVWITNAFDRSPAELLWVPQDARWGDLNGKLLNLSYGYGQIHVVPHEWVNGQAQGAICALPLDRASTGLIRGRFHPDNRHLYVAGMTAWSSNCPDDGGIFRVRPTGKPAYLPVATRAQQGRYTLTFSDPLPSTGTFHVKAWNLKRSASYGSKHLDEHPLTVTKAQISGKELVLHIPDLAPTRGMEITCEFANGTKRVIHATIHQLE